jgi:hypothetical protein
VTGTTETETRREPTTLTLPALATLAVVADAVTTSAFLSAGVGTEQNGLLVAGLEHGLSGGALVFVATQGVLLAVAWLALGAVSTYVAVYPLRRD